ncbi:MAG: PAS domain S-box protein [Desulfobulbaceae bacterium]|nr:PAS domain S-box protein [Desulfobulbaceae bacterium]
MSPLFAKSPKSKVGMDSGSGRGILVTVLLYASFAALWILFSDRLMSVLVIDHDTLLAVSILKGFFYVAVTSLLLYWLLRRKTDTTLICRDASTGRRSSLVTWPPWSLYGVAIFLSLATVFVRQGIAVSFTNRPLLILMVLPVTISAALGGFGPGLAATMLVAAATAWFIPPDGSFVITAAHDIVQWEVLIANGLLISLVCEIMLRARQRETDRWQQLLAAQGSLQESEARYRSLFEAANVGKVIILPSGEISANRAFCELLGYSREELRNKTWQELTAPQDIDPNNQLMARLLRGERDTARFEKRYLHKNGSHVWADVSVAMLRNTDGKPLYLITTVVDITEHKRAEEELRRSEARYRELFESNPHPMWIYDIETLSFLAVNTAAVAHYGYSREKFLAMTIKDIRPPEDVPRLIEKVAGIRGELHDSGTWHHRREDGSIIDVEITSHALQHNDRPARLILAHDVTERKQAEEALARSEKKFRSLFENHAAVKLIIDPENGAIVDANNAAARFYGWSVEELCGMKISQINTLGPEEIKKEIEKVRSLQNTHFEFSHRKADGAIVDVEVFSSKVEIDGKTYLHSIIHDITEKRQLEKQLLQAQKMESVGRLAGGVAHDFNNMLGVILGNTEMALDKVDPSDPLHRDLMDILSAAGRSAEITRQLLAFARKQTISPRVIDLNVTVEGMLKILRRLIGEDIDLVWLPGSGIWPVMADPSQIDQILANLCVNARDAIAGVGKVTIETANVTFDEAHCADHAGFVPGDFVLLAVSDDGCGMEKGIIDHVFEPFFTTKEIGRGTGLGLAMVYGIVKQNKGFISVYSEPGKGTTLKIYLPRQTGEADLAEMSGEKELPAGSGETVLLVEDEVSLLVLTKRILTELGYAVLEAATPGQALALAREHAGRIDLLLTDVVMPEMNGRELAGRLQGTSPELKVLYMSGYTANVIAHHGVLETGVHFIPKPFTKRDLAVKVREVLGQG